MNWRNACTSEEDLGNGRHQVVIGLKSRAFLLDGSWREIPPAFSDTGDANLPRGRRGLLTTRMADRLAGQSPQVHVGRGKYHLRMSALGTNNVPGLVYLDGTGREIGRRYNGAWQGADLEWIDIGHRVRKHIYLHTGHPSVFEVRIDDRAGNLVATSRGWDLLDDAGSPVLYATPGYLFRPDDPTAGTVPVETSVRVQGGKSIYRYTLPPGKWAGYTLDPTWTSQPGAAEGEDTEIYGLAAATDRNYGITTYTASGIDAAIGNINRGLIRFGSLTFSGSVQSATLQLTRIAGADNISRNVAVHRALLQWYEGQQDGAEPTAGQDGSTWNNRNHNGPVAWGAAGGQSGTDYAASATATTAITGDADYTWDITADVVAWKAGTANWGLWAIGNQTVINTYKTFASSDHATAAWRPSLTVEYSGTPGAFAGRGRIPILSRGRW